MFTRVKTRDTLFSKSKFAVWQKHIFAFKARAHYERAIDINPGHADALGNLSVLLHCSLREYEAAHSTYCMALEADPFHANNHGKFFNSIHFSFFFRLCFRGLICFSKINTSIHFVVILLKINIMKGNYALFLSEVKQDYQNAIKHYRMSLEIDASHPNTLYNYGVLMDR